MRDRSRVTRESWPVDALRLSSTSSRTRARWRQALYSYGIPLFTRGSTVRFDNPANERQGDARMTTATRYLPIDWHQITARRTLELRAMAMETGVRFTDLEAAE